jgi:hypothetical protein
MVQSGSGAKAARKNSFVFIQRAWRHVERALTDAGSDPIITDYFAMLADDMAGHSYNKAEHRRQRDS